MTNFLQHIIDFIDLRHPQFCLLESLSKMLTNVNTKLFSNKVKESTDFLQVFSTALQLSFFTSEH